MKEQESYFNRERFIKQLEQPADWDIIIIGGGATGLGAALDAASRGYKTLVLEQADFAKGTSSRSTKLVHGGVRYLAQGDVALVYEALHERGLLLQNAPHLVKKQSFIIPCYSWFSKMKYLIGLKMYDWLAGKFSFGSSKLLSKNEMLQAIPEMKGDGLTGGVEYWDGQFDDARLAVNIAQTCAEQGGAVLNYIKVTCLLKEGGKVKGVTAEDLETGKEFQLKSKVVINATGIFVDDILQMDVPGQRHLVRPSQGVHIVLDKSFLSGSSAMMIPETADGRVLFAVPWHDHIIVGTTDTPLESHSLEPIALEQEINFILGTAGQYMTRIPSRKDVLAVFAGLRPLAAPDKNTNSTKEISRSHKLITAPSGLITITGGKWTTYRKMAEDTIDQAIKTGGLKPAACPTKKLKIHGANGFKPVSDYLKVYGSDAEKIKLIERIQPELAEKIIPGKPYNRAEIVWAVRNEMARTVEDVLARRMRVLFLDAKTAIAMAPETAKIMAEELGYDMEWQGQQVQRFEKLAERYLLEPLHKSA